MFCFLPFQLLRLTYVMNSVFHKCVSKFNKGSENIQSFLGKAYLKKVFVSGSPPVVFILYNQPAGASLEEEKSIPEVCCSIIFMNIEQKCYWSIFNGILGKIKIPVIPPLLVNDNFETNFLMKANTFNDHFSSQCSLIANDSILPDMYFTTNNRLNNITFDHNNILKIIKHINPAKAHGWDGIYIK